MRRLTAVQLLTVVNDRFHQQRRTAPEPPASAVPKEPEFSLKARTKTGAALDRLELTCFVEIDFKTSKRQ